MGGEDKAVVRQHQKKSDDGGDVMSINLVGNSTAMECKKKKKKDSLKLVVENLPLPRAEIISVAPTTWERAV